MEPEAKVQTAASDLAESCRDQVAVAGACGHFSRPRADRDRQTGTFARAPDSEGHVVHPRNLCRRSKRAKESDASYGRITPVGARTTVTGSSTGSQEGSVTARTEPKPGRRRRRRAGIAVAAGAVAIEAAVVARRRGSFFAVDTIVRCRDGHIFTTLWVPGASLKAIRLGWWRIQRCPVGRHWSLVTPVDAGTLSQEERALAGGRHDIRVP